MLLPLLLLLLLLLREQYSTPGGPVAAAAAVAALVAVLLLLLLLSTLSWSVCRSMLLPCHPLNAADALLLLYCHSCCGQPYFTVWLTGSP